MEQRSARYDPSAVEAEVRAFWKARSLPPATGTVGTGGGPMVCQLLAAVLPKDPSIVSVHGALLADVAARYLALAGQRSSTALRLIGDPIPESVAKIQGMLSDAGIWIGAVKGRSLDVEDHLPEIQAMVDRLAASGVIVTRDIPFRTCPACHEPRTPEAIIYQEEEAPAYLVRFPLINQEVPISALVWFDVAWKLIGTSALLLNPTLPYVVARLRREGREERVLTLRSSLPLLQRTLRNIEIEVIEEHPGSTWNGTAYAHPLANEVPTLNQLSPPAGTLIGTLEIADNGTGIVGLIPAHGGTDAEVAQALHVPGWPVVSATGILDRTLAHKYAGLELDIGTEFILRDLQESGSLLGEIRVRRGVPHCALCGTPLVWQPARAWCLQPSRLDREWTELYHRLLPNDLPLESLEVAPWPVSLAHPSDDPNAMVLLECDRCERLAANGSNTACACGGGRFPVRRRLLPFILATFGAAARFQPFSPGDAVHFFVSERRRGPLLAHQIVTLAALPAKVGDSRITLLPTLPLIDTTRAVSREPSQDALRAALVRMDRSVGTEPVFREHCAQELRRLRKLWTMVRRVSESMERDGFVPDSAPVSAALSELLEEDRAILSVFERRRIDVLRAYENGEYARAHRLLHRFLEHDLRENYWSFVQRRLETPGLSLPKSSLYRTLTYLFVQWTVLNGPIAPFTSETVYRLFRGEGQSLFEGRFAPLQQALLDPGLERTFDRWLSIMRALDGFRQESGTPAGELLPLVVLSVREEAFGAELQEGLTTLRRLTGAREIKLVTPELPWEGRRVVVRPIETEIQRAYPRRASQIIHILRQMPGARVQEGLRNGTLSIVLDGQRETIAPSMVELTERIDEGIVAVPWSLGELYVRPPKSPRASNRRPRPALTAEEFALLGSIRRALAQRAPGTVVDAITVAATGRLLEDLSQHARSIAEYLGIPRVDVIAFPDQLGAAGSMFGRSSRGERWGFHVPGEIRPSPRPTLRVRTAPRSRLRPIIAPGGAATAEVDFLDDAVRAREDAVRAWVPLLDARLGAPLLGPAKLATLWQAGIQDIDSLSHASYDQLASLPGFGPVVAAEVVQKLGGSPPDRVVRRWLAGLVAKEEAAVAALATAEANRLGAAASSLGTPSRSMAPTDLDAVVDSYSPVPPQSARPRRPRARSAKLPRIPEASGLEAGSSEETESTPSPATSPNPPQRGRRTPAPPSSSPAPNVRPSAAPILEVDESPSEIPRGPAPELVPVAPPLPPPPPPAGVELWLGRSSAVPLGHFLEATGAGHRGLCITREFPDRLKAYVGKRDVNVIWLTNVGRGTTVKPTDLGGIVSLIQRALREQQVTAFFLEGIEYLVRLHTADRMVAVLLEIDAEARQRDVRVWIPVHPELIPAADLDRLRTGLPRTLLSDGPI